MDPTEIPQRPPSLGQLLRDITSHSVVNGVVAMLFASTGPVAIIFATAQAHDAQLLTCDAHFDGLPGVALVEKVKT